MCRGQTTEAGPGSLGSVFGCVVGLCPDNLLAWGLGWFLTRSDFSILKPLELLIQEFLQVAIPVCLSVGGSEVILCGKGLTAAWLRESNKQNDHMNRRWWFFVLHGKQKVEQRGHVDMSGFSGRWEPWKPPSESIAGTGRMVKLLLLLFYSCVVHGDNVITGIHGTSGGQ